MNEPKRSMSPEEVQTLAVLVMDPWKSCADCGFRDYPKYKEGPVCFLTYKYIKSECDSHLKATDCPWHEAIGVIETNGHVKYFHKTKDIRPCIAKKIKPAEDKNPCIGYGRSEYDDEPCEMCKQCPICEGNDPEDFEEKEDE